MFHVGETIRRIREDRHISQQVLACKSDMTPSYISLVENGRRTPSLGALAGIADALEIPLEVLIWDSVEVPDDLPEEDREICNAAKLIVRRYLGTPHARPSS